MNPRFTEVDIEPDEDLNTKLKFYVSSPLAPVDWMSRRRAIRALSRDVVIFLFA